MTKELFVIGDVHGECDLLEEMLCHVDFERYQLIFVGDLIDRGPRSKDTVMTVMTLVNEKKAICLKGNHEDIFLQWLDSPTEKMDWYLRNGGQATIENLLYAGVFDEKTPDELACAIREQYPEMIAFFKGLPLYYETDDVICVHAGIDLLLENWRDTSYRDFIWIREPFHHAKNTTGKTVVFGHTPVQNLRGRLDDTRVWCHQQKIGIDGGAVYKGALNGVVLQCGVMKQQIQIFHPKHQFEVLPEQSMMDTPKEVL